MRLIKNFSQLATTKERKIVLEILEEGLQAIQPEQVLQHSFTRKGNTLTVQSENLDLKKYSRVFVVGFGKGSAGISQIIESVLGDQLTGGHVIDTTPKEFEKIHFTLGTHPFPSEENLRFTHHILETYKNLSPQDLVFVVICGGGSAMFEKPFAADLKVLQEIYQMLFKSGATIAEVNTLRKHLSQVKGGGLAKHLFPAKVVSLIFSDVPGNDLSVIASGPTARDTTTMLDAQHILNQYIKHQAALPSNLLTETPREEKYFSNVSNIIMLSNLTALKAMEEAAGSAGYKTALYSDRLQGDAKQVGEELLKACKKGEVLLAGGETTVRVHGNGRGGRNQTVVLSALSDLDDSSLIVSIDSDGIDNYQFAGAIADKETKAKVKALQLKPMTYLENDDSYTFFEKVGDGILTDRLESNVADLIMVMKL